MSRSLLALAIVAAGLAGLTAGAGASGGPSPGISNGWDGIVGPSGKVRYVAVSSAHDTVVEKILVGSGRVLEYGSIPGFYGVPLIASNGETGGLTRNGKSLVLSTYPGAGKETRLVVVDTKTLTVRKRVTLHGVWSFDALSPDGRMIYLIQYLAAPSYSHYLVRAYDLALGRLVDRVIADQAETGPMTGSPRARVTSADGTWAYTLYLKPNGTAFVHALDTKQQSAKCVDLPWKTWSLWSSNVQLGFSRDGRKLVIRMYQPNGPAAVVDRQTFQVTVSKPT